MKSSLRMLLLTKSTYCDNALTNSIKKKKILGIMYCIVLYKLYNFVFRY